MDPDSLNPDPDTDLDSAFQVNPDSDPIRIQDLVTKNVRKKKIQLKFF